MEEGERNEVRVIHDFVNAETTILDYEQRVRGKACEFLECSFRGRYKNPYFINTCQRITNIDWLDMINFWWNVLCKNIMTQLLCHKMIYCVPSILWFCREKNDDQSLSVINFELLMMRLNTRAILLIHFFLNHMIHNFYRLVCGGTNMKVNVGLSLLHSTRTSNAIRNSRN